MTEVGLTAGQAARQLGVAVTTLRSWHRRYGLGPTRHAAGRHRRYGAEDLDRLATMRTLTAQGVPAAEAARLALAGVRMPDGAPAAVLPAAGSPAGSPAAPPARTPARLVAGLLDLALRLDSERVRRLVARSIAARGTVPTWDELVRPVLAEIGRRHAATGELVDVEHLFSLTVGEAFAAVARPVGVPVRVLLSCAEDEQHVLPLAALAAAAAERGVRCRRLGARVPTSALVAAVRRTAPALLVVWSHTPATGDPGQLREVLRGEPRPAVTAAAGPGWAGDLPTGVVVPADLAEAVALTVAVALNASSAVPPPAVP